MISGLCYWYCGHSYTYDFVDVCIKCCMTVKPQKCEVNLPSYSFCFCFTYLTSIAFYNRPIVRYLRLQPHVSEKYTMQISKMAELDISG